MKPFLNTLIKHNFPSSNIVHAFGYGSAVFQQANYQIDVPNQVIDVILVVDSAEEFHKTNFDINYKHYSAFPKRLPLGFTSQFVQRSGSMMYFNPLIPLSTFKNGEPDFVSGLKSDKRKLKYGVIQKDDAIQDLIYWDRFAYAGRM